MAGFQTSDEDFTEARRMLEPPESKSKGQRKESTSPEILDQMLEENEIDLASENVLVVYDKDGPLEDPSVSTAKTHPGVEEVVGSLEAQKGFAPAVVSGWDVDTLRRRRDEYLNDDFLLAGSMGTVVEGEGGKKQVHQNVHKKEIYSAFQNIFDAAAQYGEEDSGLKILPQSNFSNIVASVKFDAENERTGVGKLSGEITTEDIYDAVKTREGTEFELLEDQEREKIAFDNNLQNAELLTEVLTQDFTYPGVRFEEKNGRIAFYRDRNDRSDIGRQEGYEILREAVPNNLAVEPYDDWGVDVINEIDGEFGKPQGVADLGEKAFEGDYSGFMVGDSITDVEVAEEIESMLFVAVSGSSAEEYIEEELDWNYGEEYAVVENAVDFTESLSDLMDEAREDWNHEPEVDYRGNEHRIAT